MNDRIQIVLVDDHQVFREGLKALLEEEKDLNCIGEASDSKSLFRLLNRVSPNLILLDIQLPGENGLEIARKLKEKHPHIRILILSTHPESEFIQTALNSGHMAMSSKLLAAKS
ncbi:response regulator transcription factor [bacterium SCSIO 12741]|nr:response regulator transcription factor [bacterium SCSIO 12741]